MILNTAGSDVTTDINQEEARKAQARIAQFHSLLARRNHFELLGVNRDTPSEAVREAFKNLAKRWHTDAFSNIDIGPEQQKLDEIFQRLNEAYETLTDPGRREEYIVFLDRSARGLSTDVHGILRAEAMVDDALMDMRRRQWDSAMEKLDEARQLNPDDPLYDVHHAWAQYHRARGDAEGIKRAVGTLKVAVKRQENLALAYQYLGQIFFNLKNYAEAKKWWKLCLEYDPRNVDVQRGMRLINTRASKQQQQSGLSGLFNKLLGKK